jgi:Flp pilus assembly protein TadG
MLPLMAVLFSVLDLSMAIFAKNTVQFAVCQGVRYAITSRTMSGIGQDASIKAVVQGYTLGLLDYMSADHVGRNRITITYYDPVTLALITGTGSNVGGNIVVVSASGLSWAWMVPLLRSTTPLQFAVSSADIMEATPVAGAPTR